MSNLSKNKPPVTVRFANNLTKEKENRFTYGATFANRLGNNEIVVIPAEDTVKQHEGLSTNIGERE